MATENLQEKLIVEYNDFRQFAHARDFSALPKAFIFHVVMDYFLDVNISSFKAIDIRNIVLFSKQKGWTTETLSESQCEKYLQKELGVKPYWLGVKDGVYALNDKEYSISLEKKKKARRDSKDKSREEMSLLNVKLMKAWLSENPQFEGIATNIYPKQSGEFSITFKIVYTLPGPAKRPRQTFKEKEVSLFTKAMVDYFGVKYEDLFCQHSTEQADGESYPVDGRDLHNMIFGIGPYTGVGDITFFPRFDNIFFKYINNSIIDIFIDSTIEDSVSSLIVVDEDSVSIDVYLRKSGTYRRSIDMYQNSYLHLMLTQIFVYATNMFPNFSISWEE